MKVLSKNMKLIKKYNNSIKVHKKILRKKILAYRKNNYKIICFKYNFLINILKKFNLSKNKKIGAYFPINYEVNCLEILEQLDKSGHKISLPITRKGNKMDFFEWSTKDPLFIGEFGIAEPFSKKKNLPRYSSCSFSSF